MSRILAGVRANAALLRGVDTMTNLLRPTLGPLPRTVAIGRLTSLSQGPEILDNGAVIARRTIQLADPFENMGAMLIRHLAWRVYERAGDGTATAAVLAQAILHAGAAQVGAGANPLAIKRGLQCAMHTVTPALRRQARAIDGPADIARVIRGNLAPPYLDLADMLGEVLDTVGPDGAILVEDAPGTCTSHEYVDGVRWTSGFFSSFLLRADEANIARLVNPRVLLTDYPLQRPEELLPVLETCAAAGERSLLIVAPDVAGVVVGWLVTNRERGVLESVAAVKAPAAGVQQTRILEDLAALTGARCFFRERADRLADVVVDDLGRARQAWASQLAFGILGGAANKARVRERIAHARRELDDATDDTETADLIRERIGKLAGAAAIVRVGAPGVAEQADLRLRIQAAIRSARAALADGVVPGGGAALLACTSALDAVGDGSLDADAALGVRVLAHALAEPMRAIAANAGLEPAPIVRRARGEDHVFDVVRRAWVDPWRDGPIDPLAVVHGALEAAVSMAMTALTADVLVHRTRGAAARKP